MSEKNNNNNNKDSSMEELRKSRKEKVENFEINLCDTDADEDEGNGEIEDLMSYSDEAQRPSNVRFGSGEGKFAPNFEKIGQSVAQVKFFRSVWLVMVVSICLMLGQFVAFGTLDMLAITRDEGVLQVEIPKGAGKMAVADILHDKGVIGQPTFFKLYLLLTKGS